MNSTEIRKSTKKFVSVKAMPHTPPYKIHRYFARRPWNLFSELIQHYSNQGDIVLDPFCGGGVTIYESIKLKRNVIGCDLNPLSIFIIKNMFHNVDLQQLEVIYEKILKYLTTISKKSFETSCNHCKNPTLIHWYNLAHIVKCEKCSYDVELSNKNKIINGKYRCTNQKCSNSKEGFFVARVERKKPSYLNINGKCTNCNSKLNIPITPKLLAMIDSHISELKAKLSKKDIVSLDELIPLNWDRQAEDLLNAKGFKKFSQLFTEKNFLINALLLKKINEYKKNPEFHQILRFVFSASLRDTNVMSFTASNWQNGTPNTWAKHAYWTPLEFCEVNPLIAFSKSYKSLQLSVKFNIEHKLKGNFVSSFPKLKKNNEKILLKTGIVNDLKLPKNSIDVIITDPPYGSNVQYLELSQFWHMWNSDLYDSPNINHELEAVVNRKLNHEKSKTHTIYEQNLLRVFKECYRVLKEDGKMIMTFNNKSLNSWLALLFSIFRSGFHLDLEKIVFQDGVSQYKETAHTRAKGSPFGDFIYEFSKDSLPKSTSSYSKEALLDFINTKLDDSIIQHTNGKNKNEILIDFFESIVPKLELFVNSKDFDECHDIYEIFTKKQLHFLYD
jgi:putative DNA methylase